MRGNRTINESGRRCFSRGVDDVFMHIQCRHDAWFTAAIESFQSGSMRKDGQDFKNLHLDSRQTQKR